MKKAVLLILIFAISVVLIACSAQQSTPEVDAFAKCLSEKGTKMYGAYWCAHCAKQKKMFKSSFEFIDYVECDPKGKNPQTDLCLELNIESYPTWIFSDGKRLVSEIEFEMLAKYSGCEYQVV